MLSNIWSWIKDKYNRFQDWVASWMPGLKTKVVAGLGLVSSVAAVLQEYISGLPLSTFMTATEIAVVNVVLFSLVFWFRSLSAREDVA